MMELSTSRARVAFRAGRGSTQWSSRRRTFGSTWCGRSTFPSEKAALLADLQEADTETSPWMASARVTHARAAREALVFCPRQMAKDCPRVKAALGVNQVVTSSSAASSSSSSHECHQMQHDSNGTFWLRCASVKKSVSTREEWLGCMRNVVFSGPMTWCNHGRAREDARWKLPLVGNESSWHSVWLMVRALLCFPNNLTLCLECILTQNITQCLRES